MAGRIGSGTRSFLSGGLETVKGLAVARGNLYPLKTNGIQATFNVLRADVDSGDRLTQIVVDLLKGKVAGPLTMSAFAQVGMDLCVNSFGNATYPAAVASQPTTADGTTLNGQTLHSVASVAGYYKGQLVKIFAPPNQELVQIADIDTVAKTIATKAMKAGTPLTSGYPIIASAQHWITPRLTTDTFAWDNPTHSLEANKGFQYAWLYPGCRNLKTEFRAAQADVELVHTIAGTEDPEYLASGSFTLPSWPSLARRDVRRPMTIRRAYAIVPNDQLGLGDPGILSRLVGLESWNVTWDNVGVDKQFWDGDENKFMDSYVTKQTGTVNYVYSNASGRNFEYDKYLISEEADPVPIFFTMVRNRGTAAAPDWIGIGVYIPAMQITVGTESWPNNNTGTVNVTGDITMPDDSSAPIQLWVMNDQTTPYLAAGTLHP